MSQWYNVRRSWLERLLGNFVLLLGIHKKKSPLFFLLLSSYLDLPPGIAVAILSLIRGRHYFQKWESTVIMSLNIWLKFLGASGVHFHTKSILIGVFIAYSWEYLNYYNGSQKTLGDENRKGQCFFYIEDWKKYHKDGT